MKIADFDQLAPPIILEICGFWLKIAVFMKTVDFDHLAPLTILKICSFQPKIVVFMKTVDFDQLAPPTTLEIHRFWPVSSRKIHKKLESWGLGLWLSKVFQTKDQPGTYAVNPMLELGQIL